MVNARLHIICGNCGRNDMFEWELEKEFENEGEDNECEVDCVYLSCRNCATIHNLNDNAKYLKEQP